MSNLNQPQYGLLFVQSTHEALNIEQLAIAAQLAVRIIPTPEAIDASCGFSIKYELKEEEALVTLCQEHHQPIDALYHVYQTPGQLKKDYQQIVRDDQ